MSSMIRTHSSILPGFTGYLRTSVKACAQGRFRKRAVRERRTRLQEKSEPGGSGAEAGQRESDEQYNGVTDPWCEPADGEAGGRGRGGHMVREGAEATLRGHRCARLSSKVPVYGAA